VRGNVVGENWDRLKECLQEAKAHDAIGAHAAETGQQPKPVDSNVAPSSTREAFLRPILKKKGFSVHDWENQAHVDFHTANDYLKGKTEPYQSTRKKLAVVLDLKVEKLPA
jgi:hypothetical protein